MPTLSFSRFYPSYHILKGQPTQFVDKFWKSMEVHFPSVKVKDEYLFLDGEKEPFWGVDTVDDLKYHTIRAGKNWKVGQYFTPRTWSARPYRSNHKIFAPDTEIKQLWDFEVKKARWGTQWLINGTIVSEEAPHRWFNGGIIEAIAKNDGLELSNFLLWFKHPKPFSGQIICWVDDTVVKY